LLIRFSQILVNLRALIIIFGTLTLLIARTTALAEFDGKKIVALSTLSQLGLILLALSLGGPLVSFFHLLTHALAKANLFLMIGSFIHRRRSQQDIRIIGLGFERNIFTIRVLIRILSLCGIAFSSGFFSKDLILVVQFSKLNRRISLLIFLRIISLTIAYCLKLLKFLVSSFYNMKRRSPLRISLLLSTISLRRVRIFRGFFLLNNSCLFTFLPTRILI
jgi:NADH:ubiquinone oxidoreductase subunit 5 (subunit L)/multisubunit Na+/H+ antiporter MnhA subunit